MTGIRSSDTKPEVLTRKALHRLGYRYRLDSRAGKIKPDIVLSLYRVAVFVHGCYWHQHKGCKLAYSDRDYSAKWIKKFQDNQARDLRVKEQLLKAGWRVAVLWECTTRNNAEFNKTMKRLDKFIRTGAARTFETSYRKT